jgi:hypothetical protein
MITSLDPTTAIKQCKADLATMPALESMVLTIPAGEWEIFQSGEIVQHRGPIA